MDNQIQICNIEQFGEIRFVTRDGDPWLVGKDVATALGYVNTKDALAKHVPNKFKRGEQIATPWGVQNMTLINEAGMWRLVLRSKLPKAEEFTDKVCGEILPSIRKTGMYIANPEIRSILAQAKRAEQKAKELEHSILGYGAALKAKQLQSIAIEKMTAGDDEIAIKTARLNEDNNNPYDVPYFIRRFIAERCVLDKWGYVPRSLFLKRLREEYPESTANLSDVAITEEILRIDDIYRIKTARGCDFCGIRFNYET